MDLDLADRVFLVTGASSGLGRATAEALLGEGARVVVSGRSASRLQPIADGTPGRVRVVEADNADPGTPSRLTDAAREEWGRLDGALVSVGGPPPGSVGETDEEAWRAGFESVFLGAVRLMRHVGSLLADGEGGAIGLVLSSSVREPIPGLAVSNGLRPGLAMASKTLADELGPRGVRVVGLLPGRIDTARVRELDASRGERLGGGAEEARAASEESIPLRRYGRPDEFGRVAAFTLSPAASYLTGVMVPVDGGLMRGL